MRRHSIAGSASVSGGVMEGSIGGGMKGSKGVVATGGAKGSGGSGGSVNVTMGSEEGVSESMLRAMAHSSNTLKLRLASGQGQGLGGDNRARARSPLLPLPGTRWRHPHPLLLPTDNNNIMTSTLPSSLLFPSSLPRTHNNIFFIYPHPYPPLYSPIPGTTVPEKLVRACCEQWRPITPTPTGHYIHPLSISYRRY